MKRQALLSLMILLVTILFSCDITDKTKSDTISVNPQPDPLADYPECVPGEDPLNYVLRDNKDAELMALSLSGEMVAPENLYNTIANDLNLIRTAYSDEYDFLNNIHFRLPWEVGCIMIKFDEPTAQEVMNDNYHEWDCLNEKYGIKTIDKGLLNNGLAILKSEYRLSSPLLGKLYLHLQGVVSISNNGIIGDSSNIYARKIDNKMTYLFRYGSGDCPSGCIINEYIYFEVEDGNAVLIGYWKDRPAWWDEAQKNINQYYGR